MTWSVQDVDKFTVVGRHPVTNTANTRTSSDEWQRQQKSYNATPCSPSSVVKGWQDYVNVKVTLGVDCMILEHLGAILNSDQ